MCLRRILRWRKKPFGDEIAVAEQAFLRENPGQRIGRTSILAREDNHVVVGVFYGDTRPPRFWLVTVDLDDRSVSNVLDPRKYVKGPWR